MKTSGGAVLMNRDSRSSAGSRGAVVLPLRALQGNDRSGNKRSQFIASRPKRDGVEEEEEEERERRGGWRYNQHRQGTWQDAPEEVNVRGMTIRAS